MGNLPAHASVLIKITYVSELLVEGENICFNVPGSVAPWKKDAGLDEITQVSLLDRYYIRSHIMCFLIDLLS